MNSTAVSLSVCRCEDCNSYENALPVSILDVASDTIDCLFKLTALLDRPSSSYGHVESQGTLTQQ